MLQIIRIILLLNQKVWLGSTQVSVSYTPFVPTPKFLIITLEMILHPYLSNLIWITVTLILPFLNMTHQQQDYLAVQLLYAILEQKL